MENKVYGFIGLAMRAGKVTFGTESCLDMMQKRKIKLLVIASDSSTRTIQNLKQKAEMTKTSYCIIGTKEELSNAIGKYNKTVLGIKDTNLANAIKKLLNGGDVIG